MTSPAASPPLSIVHVFRAPVGGLFRHVADLAREQSLRGVRVGMIADSLTGGTRANEAFEELAPLLALGVHRLPIPRNPGPADLANIVKVGRILSSLAPDVAHGHGSKGGLYARAPGLLGPRGPVRAYTPHGGSFIVSKGLQGAVYMATERLLARATDLFLFESAYIRGRFEEFVNAPDDRKHVTPNGVSEAEFAHVPRRADAADFLYIGELRAIKGIDTLLDALGILTRERAFTLNIVGAGPDDAMLRERAAALGLGERVKFLGAMPARDAFATGRVMVVPSRAESLPYVVIEAVAAEMPIVATNVGGIPQIMEPLASELIAPDDSVALAQAMARVASLPSEEAARRSQALSAHARDRFTISAMTDSILMACARAVEAKRAAGRLT